MQQLFCHCLRAQIETCNKHYYCNILLSFWQQTIFRLLIQYAENEFRWRILAVISRHFLGHVSFRPKSKSQPLERTAVSVVCTIHWRNLWIEICWTRCITSVVSWHLCVIEHFENCIYEYNWYQSWTGKLVLIALTIANREFLIGK